MQSAPGSLARRRSAKLFQGFPNFSKEIPNLFQAFSKDFQTFSLAVSKEIKGLLVGRPGSASFLAFCVVSAAMSGPA